MGNIEKALVFKMYSVVAFIDVECVFYTVHSKAIVTAPRRRNVSELFTMFVTELFTKRIINDSQFEVPMAREVNRRSPQRGVLPPCWGMS